MHLARKFAEESGIHGIRDFRRIKSPWALTLWAVIVAACSAKMIFEMYMIVWQYRQHPTATQVTPLFLDNYPYPRFIFCPKEWINESKIAEFNISKPVLIYALSLLKYVSFPKEQKTEFIAAGHNLTELHKTLKFFLKSRNYSSYYDFYRLIANDPNTVSRCDRCDFTHKHVSTSGVCIQVRLLPASSAFLIQSPPAFLYTVPHPTAEYEHLMPKYSGIYTADALYVTYLPQNEFYLYNPVLLNRNSSYILRIKPTLYQRLFKPGKPCVTPEEYKTHGLTQVQCYAKCDDARKRTCRSCFYLGSYPGGIADGGDFSVPLCSSLIPRPPNENCSSADRTFNLCVRQCHPFCHEWVYETTLIPVSQRKLLTASAEADVTVVFSYQVRFGETQITEVPTYSWDSFLSNWAGQIGLWLGASVVSILQLFHFLATFVFEKCFQRKRRSENITPTDDGNRSDRGHRNGEMQMRERNPTIFFVRNTYSNYSSVPSCLITAS